MLNKQIIITTAVLWCLSLPLFAQLTINIVNVPHYTPSAVPIYITGDFNNWQAANADFAFYKNNNGYQIKIYPPVGKVNFKLTRGDWASVEANQDGCFRANREVYYNGNPSSIDIWVDGWEDLKNCNHQGTAAYNVYCLDNDFYMPQLERKRKIWLYLPPDYANTQKRYPVIYLQDGQNVFDASNSFSGEWGVDESLNHLHYYGDYGAIVVAVENGGTHRIDEYSPWTHPKYGGGQGDEYMDFVVHTLKPYVDTNYRTKASREYTAIMGSSMGGLLSHYGIVEYQEIFGKAGIFSPAFWIAPAVYQHTSTTGKADDIRLYLLAGQQEDNGSVVQDIDKMEQTLYQAGFSTYEVKKVTHYDGQHSEWYWNREFIGAYQWLFSDIQATRAYNVVVPPLIRIYPNPAKGILNIENYEQLAGANIRLYDLKSNLILEKNITQKSVSIKGLLSGVYIVTILRDGALLSVDKLVVE